MKKLFTRLLVLTLCVCVIASSISVSAATSISYSPYPKVEYSYSSSVSAGTFRYISQVNGSSYFYSSYWGGWASNAGWECGTASISMALSYIGINKTPKNILDANNGITYFTGWGATYLAPNISTAMSNYINGNGKYSPPIVHFTKYGNSTSHYVLLIGQVSSNAYLVLDPAAENTWILYTSDERYKSIDEVHQYYTSSASVQPPIVGAPSISTDKIAYQVGETVTVTRNTVTNTNFYQLVIWYGGEQIISTAMPNSTYSFTVDTAGEYHIYLQVGNATSGVLSTEKYVIYAENQIDTVPTVIADKDYYTVGEEIVFARNEVPNTNYYQLKVCYVDEAGGEAQILSTGMTNTTYSYSIDTPRKYYVYMSVGNSVSGVSSSKADVFYVQAPVTESPEIWLDRDSATYEYGEDVIIYRNDVDNATDYHFVLGNFQSGDEKRIDITNETYVTLNALDPGSYSIFAYADNAVTDNGELSDVLYFTVEEPHTHSYSPWISVSPTCKTDGIRTYDCTCGDSYDEVIAALGHDIISATCTEAAHCSRCDYSEGEPLGHTYSYSVIVEPTCDTDGRGLYRCSCGDYYVETISALGHNSIPATCTEHEYCSRCDAELSEPLGHSYTATVTKQPSCTAYGIKTYVCSVCFDSYAEAIAKTNHIYSPEYTVDVEPTFFEPGIMSRHCLSCTASTDHTAIDPIVPSAVLLVSLRKTILEGGNDTEYDYNGDDVVDIRDLIKLKKSYAGVY